MKIMHSRIILLFLAALLLLGVAGCGGGQRLAKAPAAGVPTTRTPKPTFTPRPTNTQPAPTSTPAPTDTPLPPTEPPAATAPPAAPPKAMLTVNALVNVRGGPGATYERLGQLQAGQQLEITGRTAEGDWWQFSYDGDPAWVAGSMVTVNDAANGVAVVEAPPPPVRVVQAPAPAAQPQPQAPPQPQPSPVPQTRFAAAGMEARDAGDTHFDQVTFWGRLGDTSSGAPLSDAAKYKVKVVGPTGTAEKPLKNLWEVAYSGWPENQFIYNAKIELKRGVGNWSAVIVDGSGAKVSDEQSGSLTGTTHDVILTWRPR